ncbi:MAG: hypothetical protein LAO55_12935 [Acidobacteriia bacterium]|nr:hypothetical protein [Terriglobia bacterium]
MSVEAFCPLCEADNPEVESSLAADHGQISLRCRRCGSYRLSRNLALNRVIPKALKPYLSAAASQASDAGSPLLFDTDNLEEMAAPHQNLSIAQRAERVLSCIAKQVELPGKGVRVIADDIYPLADCRSKDELQRYIEHLEDEGLLKKLHPQGIYEPSIKGWQAIEPTLNSDGDPKLCFVAMWFDDSLDSVFVRGFESAIRDDCNFKPYRVKEDPTNKAVVDRIFSGIRQSRFVVADFTGNRQSVYYEAGFASGLGLEVISCCREDYVKHLTFDTRHLGHVVWKDADDLRSKLADSIRANIIPKR